MTAMLASAYMQIRPAERAFVDGYVSDLEREAERLGQRISLALHRAIPEADKRASRGMLDMPLVQAAIVERVNDVAARTELTPQRLIREVMAVGFSNMEDYVRVGEDGSPRFDLSNLSRDQWAAVESFDVETDPRNPFIVRKFKMKLHSKMDAIGKLGEYMAVLARDNAYWRAEQAQSAPHKQLPAGVTVEQAGNAYAAMIDG